MGCDSVNVESRPTEVSMSVEAKRTKGPDGDEPGDEVARIAYVHAVGARLRLVRKQTKLSLQAVESLSGEEFKASVLGAYERGERAISVPRLQRLAKLYNVPVDQLLPVDGVAPRQSATTASGATGSGGGSARAITGVDKITIDLSKLNLVKGPERDLLRRFLSMIQTHRQDFNGRMISIRGDDVRTIAHLLGVTPAALSHRLDELGLLITP
jgi:hypothetical protein